MAAVVGERGVAFWSVGTSNVDDAGLVGFTASRVTISDAGAIAFGGRFSVSLAGSQGQSVTLARQLLRLARPAQGQSATVAFTTLRRHNLSASQAQSTTSARAGTRTLVSTQDQVDVLGRVVSRTYKASQVQSPTNVRVRSRIQAVAVSQGQAMGETLSVRRITMASQAQSGAFVVGVSRSVVAGQGQVPMITRRLSRLSSAVQIMGASFGRLLARASAFPQGQVPVSTEVPSRILAATQAQGGSMSRLLIRIENAIQGQLDSLVRFGARLLSSTQGQSSANTRTSGRTLIFNWGQASIVGRAVRQGLAAAQFQACQISAPLTHNVTLTALQPQSSGFIRSVGRSSAGSQGQSTISRKSFFLVVSATSAQVASVGSVAIRRLTLQQGQALASSLTSAWVLSTFQTQTLSSRAFPIHAVNVTATQAQSISFGRARSRVYLVVQDQVLTLGRALDRSTSTSQRQSLSVLIMRPGTIIRRIILPGGVGPSTDSAGAGSSMLSRGVRPSTVSGGDSARIVVGGVAPHQ